MCEITKAYSRIDCLLDYLKLLLARNIPLQSVLVALFRYSVKICFWLSWPIFESSPILIKFFPLNCRTGHIPGSPLAVIIM